jgi:Zn-dependent protease
MQSTWMNGIRLFRVFGITVFLHWTWALVAAFEIFTGQSRYSSRAWNAAEYLLLFAIVLLHEFGHALACRSVGGTAERIMLWPLGGVAYVSPPARPGALLWSIVAGPLVNFVLLFVTIPLVFLNLQGDLGELVKSVAVINVVLLAFNILPIYPLDGGQILQSLLWFVLGRGRSMLVAAAIGLAGAVLLAVSGLVGVPHLWRQNYWIVAVAIFVGSRARIGWQQGMLLRKRENSPRRTGWACPGCGTPPLAGDFWNCSNCKTKFDIFGHGGVCPACGATYTVTACGECGARSQITAWRPILAAPYRPVEVPPLLQPRPESSAPAGQPGSVGIF